MSLKSHDLIILTSPPASGKTYWISSLVNKLFPQKILVISPLRALADECRSKWEESVFVMTPEEWMSKKVYSEIVIFDEATSAMDSSTEKQIQQSMDEVILGRTAIIVAHRLATIKKADKIIVIEAGKAVEEGTFTELMCRKSRFYNYWQDQKLD